MARPELPDTTVFIRLARAGTGLGAFLPRMRNGGVWLSSVVLAELYAGTRSTEEARLLDRFATMMREAARLSTPSSEDWALAGRLMARRIRLRGAIKPRDHLNDLLILISAGRLGGTVSTANVHDFEAWLPLARASRLDVRVRRDTDA